MIISPFLKIFLVAGVIPDFSEPDEKEITRFLARRLPGCNSLSYLKFVKSLILENFSPESLNEEKELMLAIFHYDIWQKSGAEPGFVDFRESVKAIKVNPVMVAEMLEVTDCLMSKVEVVEKEIDLGLRPWIVHRIITFPSMKRFHCSYPAKLKKKLTITGRNFLQYPKQSNVAG